MFRYLYQLEDTTAYKSNNAPNELEIEQNCDGVLYIYDLKDGTELMNGTWQEMDEWEPSKRELEDTQDDE
jgi:hypothetical protein